MKDKRQSWKYRNCEISPIDASDFDADDFDCSPRDFGSGVVYRYWRIKFPNDSWSFARTKESAREYIRNKWYGLG